MVIFTTTIFKNCITPMNPNIGNIKKPAFDKSNYNKDLKKKYEIKLKDQEKEISQLKEEISTLKKENSGLKKKKFHL